MLINLVKNALKFSKRKGSIRIFAAFDKESSELRVKVVDNGIGVKKSDHSKLFKMFGKLKRTSK